MSARTKGALKATLAADRDRDLALHVAEQWRQMYYELQRCVRGVHETGNDALHRVDYELDALATDEETERAVHFLIAKTEVRALFAALDTLAATISAPPRSEAVHPRADVIDFAAARARRKGA